MALTDLLCGFVWHVCFFFSRAVHSADLASAVPYRRRGKPPVCMTSAEGNEIISFTLLAFLSPTWFLKLFHVVFPDPGRPGNDRAVSSDRTAGGGAVRWEACQVTHTHTRTHGCRYQDKHLHWKHTDNQSIRAFIDKTTHKHTPPWYTLSCILRLQSI